MFDSRPSSQQQRERVPETLAEEEAEEVTVVQQESVQPPAGVAQVDLQRFYLSV